MLADLDKRVNLRATEKVMGTYMERISFAVPQALGQRPHAFKLDNPAFFESEFETEHGHLLKAGVEKVIEKLEILSNVALKLKKFKSAASERLLLLEQADMFNLKKDDFQD